MKRKLVEIVGHKETAEFIEVGHKETPELIGIGHNEKPEVIEVGHKSIDMDGALTGAANGAIDDSLDAVDHANGNDLGTSVNTTLKNVIVTRVASKVTTVLESKHQSEIIAESNDTQETEIIQVSSNLVNGHDGETKVEIPIEYQELDSDYHQILIDFGKHNGFWPWLTRFEPVFGFKQLCEFLFEKNNVLDYQSIDDVFQVDEMLPKIRYLFDQTVQNCLI